MAKVNEATLKTLLAEVEQVYSTLDKAVLEGAPVLASSELIDSEKNCAQLTFTCPYCGEEVTQSTQGAYSFYQVDITCPHCCTKVERSISKAGEDSSFHREYALWFPTTLGDAGVAQVEMQYRLGYDSRNVPVIKNVERRIALIGYVSPGQREMFSQNPDGTFVPSQSLKRMGTSWRLTHVFDTLGKNEVCGVAVPTGYYRKTFYDNVANKSESAKTNYTPRKPAQRKVINFSKMEMSQNDITMFGFNTITKDNIANTAHLQCWCTSCGEVFETDVDTSEHKVTLECPVCGAKYNELTSREVNHGAERAKSFFQIQETPEEYIVGEVRAALNKNWDTEVSDYDYVATVNKKTGEIKYFSNKGDSFSRLRNGWTLSVKRVFEAAPTGVKELIQNAGEMSSNSVLEYLSVLTQHPNILQIIQANPEFVSFIDKGLRHCINLDFSKSTPAEMLGLPEDEYDKLVTSEDILCAQYWHNYYPNIDTDTVGFFVSHHIKPTDTLRDAIDAAQVTPAQVAKYFKEASLAQCISVFNVNNIWVQMVGYRKRAEDSFLSDEDRFPESLKLARDQAYFSVSGKFID